MDRDRKRKREREERESIEAKGGNNEA